MTDRPRLIEVAFPLKQASLDSVHEKNVRHGHISTLHIWPARRPLAACRAALIATLLPDPGTPEKRQELLEKIGGKVVTEVQKKKVGGKTVEVVKERTEGGVLHWGNENSPDMDWFREEIKKAYGGRAPRVLDPFAGGGAIPLEAMRLGCEATAIDINPVAWFILKCTLEYPQKLAGQVRPLPKFALESGEFMEAFLKGTGKLSKKQAAKELVKYQRGLFPPPEADLSWHVRAWGWWVLQQAQKDLERFYPTIDGKPTVAYLWARTVTCKNCRATIPLLKTRWLCKKDNKRVLLTMEPNADKTGVVFGVQNDVPVVGGNAAQKRDYDKKVGAGVMTKSGAKCPLCLGIMDWGDLRIEGQGQRFRSILLAVVVDGTRRQGVSTTRSVRGSGSCGMRGSVAGDCFPPSPLDSQPRTHPSLLDRGGMVASLHGSRLWVILGRALFYAQTITRSWDFREMDQSHQGHDACRGVCRSNGLRLSLPTSGSRSIVLQTTPVPYAVGITAGEKLRNTFGRFAFPIVWDFCRSVSGFANAREVTSGAVEWMSLFLSHVLESSRSSLASNRHKSEQHSEVRKEVRCHHDRPAVL